jgi:TetR/AcrR family transcriptional regulator, regulator of autoinduction and epiphytic fitness
MSTDGEQRGADPRVERSRQVILTAALGELGEAGYGAFTIESVAARAGVAKSTIYRHWPDKVTLIADAFETFHEQIVPSTGNLPARESLLRLLRHVAEIVVDSTFSACIPALIEGAERDPRLRAFRHRYSAQRRQSLTALISQGMTDGEFRAGIDPELAAQALLGPIFYRRLMTSDPFDPDHLADLIDMIVGGPSRNRPDPGPGGHR